MPIKDKKALKVWLALTLSVLFFHPLFATLHDNDIILQWRVQNSLELIAAVALFTLLLTGALWLIAKFKDQTPKGTFSPSLQEERGNSRGVRHYYH